MEEEETGAPADASPGLFVEVVFSLLMTGLILWLAEEMIFRHHGRNDICERAAADMEHAYRDVLRDCGLGEFRQMPPDPNEVE